MTGKEIIAEVIKDAGCSAELFFGRDRSAQVVAARKVAVIRLSETGLSPAQIGALMLRDRTSILYHLRPGMRAARSAACAKRWAEGKPERDAAAVLRAAAKAEARAAAKVAAAEQAAIKGNHSRPWSDTDSATATRMLDEGATNADFRRTLGRTLVAAKSHVRDLRAIKRRQEADALSPRDMLGIPPDVLAEARARVTAPRSLTAWAFGDPAPGFSAYDRRSLHATEAGT
jgi:hypothetical protein